MTPVKPGDLRIVMPWHRKVHSIWVGNLPGSGGKRWAKPVGIYSSKLTFGDSPKGGQEKPRKSVHFFWVLGGGHDLKGC